MKAQILLTSIIPMWLMQKPITPIKEKPYRIVQELLNHPESPLTLSIYDGRGKLLGSIGGFITIEGGRIVYHNNSIQGVRDRHPKDAGKIQDHDLGEITKWVSSKRHLQKFSKLNNALGENWRIYLMRLAKRFCEKHNITLIPHGPGRFAIAGAVPMASNRKHKRQQRLYKQTYRKAGIKYP